MQAALTAFGADAETLAAALSRQPPDFGLWADNEAPMRVLIAMRHQVRRAGMAGQVVGLDYGVLPWVMTQVGIPPADTAAVFARLQVAEDELLRLLRES